MPVNSLQTLADKNFVLDMVKGKTPDSADELLSNSTKLTYRKGVLLCSSVSDVTACNHTKASLPKVQNKNENSSSKINIRSSRSFSSKKPLNSSFQADFDSDQPTLQSLNAVNHTGNELHCSRLRAIVGDIPGDKSHKWNLKRSDIVSATICGGNQQQACLTEVSRVEKGITGIGKKSQVGKKQLVPIIIPEDREFDEQMASSVMNQHHPHSHSHYNNYNQRNYNNNMTNSNSYSKGITNSSSTTSNGYYNYPHSSSMNEITDNRSYHKQQQQHQKSLQNQKSNSYYGINQNQSISFSNSNQIELRKEQRERQMETKRDFVPSFVLIDACKTNNDRKVREICRKLSTLAPEDVQPVANFQDQTGRTPLSYACGGGSIMLIDELSRVRQLDPNLGDNDGNSPLHYASQAGHSEGVDLMLSRFGGIVDINCRNSTGLTPLMKAALQGRTRCAKSLLAAGASGHLRDYSRGMTAAEWARLCGRHICAEVITRGSKDNQRHSGSPPTNFPINRQIHASRSNMELKRMNSDESPYYHLYARSTISGATWLKNKIKKALGASGASTNPSVRSLADRRPTVSDPSYTLMSNLGGATICAGSLLLPSIKPLMDQQRSKALNKKMTIPTVQVTPVKR